MGLRLQQAVIPYSFYQFNDTNKYSSTNPSFRLTDGAVTNAGVTIPNGNYTSATFPAILQTALRAASPTRNYVVAFDAATQKLTVTTPSAEAFSLIFGTDKAKSPFWLLGYNAGTYTSDGTTNANFAPNVARLTGPHVLYIGSNLGNFISRGLRTDGSGTTNAYRLAAIPINVNPGGVIVHQADYNEIYYPVNCSDIQNIELWLEYDENDAPYLDLNGAPFSVEIQFLVEKDTRLPVGDNPNSVRSNKRARPL